MPVDPGQYITVRLTDGTGFYSATGGGGGGAVAWGGITGTLSAQTDLQGELDAKAATTHNHDGTYSALGHNHDAAYSALGHNHDSAYAALTHNHDAAYDAIGAATSAVSAHAGAADPHTGYQKESEKAAASGYASLDTNTRVPLAQLGSGSPSGSNFLRGDGSWAVPAGGGGGVSQLIVNLIADGAGITWTNMPAAVTFFGGSHRYATKVDLTNYTDCRLIVNKQATAGAAAAIVRLRYITAFNTTVGNWLTIGSSEVSVAVNVLNTVIVSSWIPLVAGAKADVFITLDGSGGDGVLDPVFGSIVAQFR